MSNEIRRKVFELSETERKVYELRQKDVEFKAIAERLSLSPCYVRNVYKLAKEKLALVV